ncbi:MAG: TrkA C-terminal domain-containing protein [Natronomonas sp.]
MKKISYRPQNIRETLVELKDSSELAVDLAYSAILFGNRDLAREVIELESRANYLQYHARIALMLAAKNTNDAEALVGIFQVVDGAVDITEAAADIARIQLRDLTTPAAFRALPAAHEQFVRAEIADSSRLSGRTLRELDLDVEEGVSVIAIRRDTEWVVDPDGDDQLLSGDVIYGRGPAEGIADIYEQATGDPYDPPTGESVDEDVERAIETVVELKNVSELAIGLAYSAALYDSDAIAGEVQTLERRSDELREELEGWVIDAAGAGGADNLRGLFRLAAAAEVICDATLDIAEVVFREVELHPVFGQAILESKEVIASIAVDAGDELEETTIDRIEGEIETAIAVIALDRDGEWQYDPDDATVLRADDVLIVKGPRRSVSRLRTLAG